MYNAVQIIQTGLTIHTRCHNWPSLTVSELCLHADDLHFGPPASTSIYRPMTGSARRHWCHPVANTCTVMVGNCLLLGKELNSFFTHMSNSRPRFRATQVLPAGNLTSPNISYHFAAVFRMQYVIGVSFPTLSYSFSRQVVVLCRLRIHAVVSSSL